MVKPRRSTTPVDTEATESVAHVRDRARVLSTEFLRLDRIGKFLITAGERKAIERIGGAGSARGAGYCRAEARKKQNPQKSFHETIVGAARTRGVRAAFRTAAARRVDTIGTSTTYVRGPKTLVELSRPSA
jgi:hypothetical protein